MYRCVGGGLSSLLVVMKMLNKDGQVLIRDGASVKKTIRYFIASTRDFVANVVSEIHY